MTHSSAGMPYIKREPDDFGNNSNHFMSSSNFGHPQSFGNHFTAQEGPSVDPSELSNTNFSSMQYNYGGNNISSGFSMGNSGYGEDELLASLDPLSNDGQDIFNDFTTMNQPSNN